MEQCFGDEQKMVGTVGTPISKFWYIEKRHTKRHPEVRHMSHPTCHPSHAWPFRTADSPIPGSIDALVVNVQLRRFDSGGSGHFLKGKAVRLRAHAKCKLCQQVSEPATATKAASAATSTSPKFEFFVASTATSGTTIAVGL